MVMASAFHLCLCLSIGISYLCLWRLKATVKSLYERLLLKLAAVVFALQVGGDPVHVFVGLHLSCFVSGLISLLKCNSAR
jgi:hypothetical protein